MEILKLSVTMLLSLIFSGCAIFYPRVDSSNFRDRVKIAESSNEFYSGVQKPRTVELLTLGSTKKSYSDCVPPFPNNLCNYTPLKKLEMKSYKLTLEDNYNQMDKDLSLDMAYLTASELAIQLGYSKFIVEDTNFRNYCGSSQTAETTGVISGGIYSGSTSIVNHIHCVGSLEVKVVVFNDYSDVKTGVFFIDRDSNNQYIQPYLGLYRAQKPNLLNDAVLKGVAWESYYDAKEFSEKLISKYQVGSKGDYKIKQYKRINPSEIQSLRKN